MKFCITGSAGFIGYHLCKSLLEEGYEVLGVDNLNDYYDPNLKNARLNQLKHYNNFNFEKLDISNYEKLNKVVKLFKPNQIINLAAQAGVRYSIENPFAYLNSNITGFLNVLEIVRHQKIDKLIYASSSSVYGSNTKLPFSVSDRTDNPISLYAASKKSNEHMANVYSKLYRLNTIGLRFFTVYGPWGRPDMAMFIFTKNILEGKPIPVYNSGYMRRDFTYIDDIISGLRTTINCDYSYELFNLGNNKSEKLMDMISIIEKYLNKKAQIDFQPIQLGDVTDTYADIDQTSKLIDYIPKTDISEGIPKFIDWYKTYYKID